MPKYIEEIKKIKPTAKIILCLTKQDLQSDHAIEETKISSLEDLKLVGQQYQIIPQHILECSSLTQRGLKQVFDTCIRSVNRKAPENIGKKCVSF